MLFKSIFTVFTLTLALLISGALQAESDTDGPMAGVHYEVLDPVAPTSVAEGKVEVAEVFWYGCPHCYRFEPYVKGWLKHKDENIEFVRVPGVLNQKWETHARFYYAAESLDVVEKLHEPLFIAIHEKKERLYKEEDLLDFAEARGVDREKFAEAMHSFSVDSKVKRAKQLAASYKISGVPAVVVNGKYLVSGSMAGSFKNMIVLTHMLSKQELPAPTTAENAAK